MFGEVFHHAALQFDAFVSHIPDKLKSKQMFGGGDGTKKSTMEEWTKHHLVAPNKMEEVWKSMTSGVAQSLDGDWIFRGQECPWRENVRTS